MSEQPPTIADIVNIPNARATLQETLTEHTVILHYLREHLRRTRRRMCYQANRHDIDHNFDPDDLVWVRLHPYRRHPLAPHPNHKLGPHFAGLYGVLRHIGAVAYELRLPESAHVYPVFNVSLLRPFKGSSEAPLFPSTESTNVGLPSAFN
ncbi:hypothetical protein ACSQ67_021045 [Phaseolus vulgaris]